MLHGTVSIIKQRTFEPIIYPWLNPPPGEDSPRNQYAAGWTTGDKCEVLLTTTLPQNRSTGVLPCSLDDQYNLLNVYDSTDVYITLNTGISSISTDFSGSYVASEERNDRASDQIVTLSDPKSNISHSILFSLGAGYEYDSENKLNYGVDYIANTTSMATKCEFASKICQLGVIKPTTNQSLSVPFNCSAIFHGDLNLTPSTGLERAAGWNTSFYELVDGVPADIPIQAQSNPFYFYAATVNSIPLSSNSNIYPEGALVDVGNGRTAFALSCQATIHDVTYSLVSGSIKLLRTEMSDPRKASIIQAPLQVGFGQYHLFQSASAAVLSNDLLSSMSKAFSQTGMALASGAFAYDVNYAQRFRYDQMITQVQKTPFWFLVISCLLYPILGFVAVISAFILRRSADINIVQRKLVHVTSFKRSRKLSFSDSERDVSDVER